MLLTPESYHVQCGCGQPHRVLLERALIEPGALLRLNEECEALRLPTPLVAVYDENTYTATAGRRPAVAQEIVLNPNGLHADEHGVQAVEKVLRPGAGTLIAIGAGTVHDITRYVAAKLGLPFVSAPTAASVDGFVSTVAAMTWHGFKKTMPGVSPRLLVADTDVLAAAPWRLTAAGVGDILGKYTSLADWQIAHVLTGEYYCEGIAALTKSAVDEVMASYKGLKGGDMAAYESLMKALVLSGVAMQLAGNSRPASACEHHISHLVEIGVPWLNATDALHGEKVGVGTLLCCGEYHTWAAKEATELHAERLDGYATPASEGLAPVFGPLTEEVLKENEGDCLLPVTAKALLDNWESVRAILRSVPKPAEVEKIFEELDAKRTLADIGQSEAARADILRWSPYVRNRLTFVRIRGCLLSKES